jgi:transposase InsO family protein
MKAKFCRKFLPIPGNNKPIVILSKKVWASQKLTQEENKRLKWIDFYNSHNNNVSLTCRYFGISRKTFYKWKKRYEILGIRGLKDLKTTPRRIRQPEISFEQELRIRELRKKYIRYGKEKLAVLYQQNYGEKISAWKIYRVIKKYDLYYNPVRNEKMRKKRKLVENKKRITELKKKGIDKLLFQIDTKVIWCQPAKRYIFSAIETHSKLAFSRMYKNGSSYNGRDFLLRLYYLVNEKDFYVQSDNGSEYHKYFDRACNDLKLEHYFSRVKTPKDNAQIERFNRTLEEEFLQNGNYIEDVDLFNSLLTEWLIEYNFNRPHASLGYLSPIKFLEQFQDQKVLPMYPTHTIVCLFIKIFIY